MANKLQFSEEYAASLKWVAVFSCALIGGAVGNLKGLSTNQFFFWYSVFAFGWSGFLASYAFQLVGIGEVKKIKTYHPPDQDGIRSEQEWQIPNPNGYRVIYEERTGFAGVLHQFILHFSSGIIGFVIFYLFIIHSPIVWSSGQDQSFGWEKIILLIIGFMGVTGYLPNVLLIKNWLPGK